jgi:hypothetical protein
MQAALSNGATANVAPIVRVLSATGTTTSRVYVYVYFEQFRSDCFKILAQTTANKSLG